MTLIRALPWVLGCGLMATGVVFRFLWLSQIPGLNGDEAWPMVQVYRFLSSEPMTWVTPSDRLLSPFYSAFIVLLKPFATMSVTSVRLPAVFSGLLAVGLAFFLFRRMYGTRFAFVFALLASTAPALISYSRIGWELSQVAAVGTLALYFSARANALGTWLAFIAALMTHSVNVFLFPFLFSPLFADLWASKKAFGAKAKTQALHFVLFLLTVALFLKPQAGVPNLILQFNQGRPFSSLLAEILSTLPLSVDLFAGPTIYEYFVGKPLPATHAFLQLIGASLLLTLAVLCGETLWKQTPIRWYLIGFVFSFAALVLFGTRMVFLPGHERYSLFLMVPFLFLLTHALMALPVKRPSSALWLATGVSLVWIGSFWVEYFQNTRRDGARAHRTYATGPVEPKQAAFEKAYALLAAGYSKKLLTEDYWLFWSMSYFNHGKKEIQVTQPASDDTPALLTENLKRGSVLAGFSGGPFDQTLKKLSLSGIQEHSFSSFAGVPIVKLWHLDSTQRGSP